MASKMQAEPAEQAEHAEASAGGRRRPAPRRVLILGGDADGNLGDRAILLATCQTLRRLSPEVELTVSLRDGTLFRERFGARIVPRGAGGVPALLAAMRRSDLVLVGGGGLFQDDDSLVKMPYWAMRAVTARLLSGRVVGYALGVGPLDAWISRVFGRVAFAAMQRISVRDAVAQAVARPLTPRPVEVLPDPALLLPPDDADATDCWLREQRVPLDDGPLIGVATRRWFPPRRRLLPHFITQRWRDPASIERSSAELIAGLIDVLRQAIDRHGAHVLLMPSYRREHEGDERIAEAVRAALPSPRTHLLRIDDPARYKAVTGRLAVMLGGRMHPTIFAAAMGTPVVGLGYNPKFAGFFELIDCSDRLLDVRSFVERGCGDALSRLLDEAIAHPDRHRPHTEALARRIEMFLQAVMEAQP